MSIPRNHHYISQVHIKNFFNENNYVYLFDKISGNYYAKNSSKRIFSENDLNTIFKDGVNDYSSIEKELNIYFEKDFHTHLHNINLFLSTENLTTEIQLSILYLARYAAVCNFRNPQHKNNLEQIFFNALKPAMDIAVPNLKDSFYELYQNRGDAKFLNSAGYLRMGNDILNRMGKIFFVIEVPEIEDDYFILPDFGASTIREKINNYFNPDIEEIAYIGLPLSSKIYIHFYSQKHSLNLNASFLTKLKTNQVFALNKDNLQFSNKTIACANKEYLEKFCKKVLSEKKF